MADEKTKRYQLWLRAGEPDLYPLWIQGQWRAYFEEVNGYAPGAKASLSRGIAINTEAEDMGEFVLEYQDRFDDWLEDRVDKGLAKPSLAAVDAAITAEIAEGLPKRETPYPFDAIDPETGEGLEYEYRIEKGPDGVERTVPHAVHRTSLDIEPDGPEIGHPDA